jgi:hypothetical protein
MIYFTDSGMEMEEYLLQQGFQYKCTVPVLHYLQAALFI